MSETRPRGISAHRDLYRSCRLCPRECGADRTAGKTGFCGQTAVIRAACATLHRGEEPPISGERGSGAVFFTGCTLGCPFCQNAQISAGGMGATLYPGEFSRICLDLQERGAETLNLVTATQFIPSVAGELRDAKRAGLFIPVVWNSSGYEKPEALSILDGLVDVYLPDCKTLDPELSRRLFGRADYPDAARASVRFMANRGGPLFSERGIMTRGTIVRHLVLPGCLSRTREVLEWFARELAGRALLSLLVQYVEVGFGSGRSPEGRVGQAEYDTLLEWLDEFGIEDGFIQELGGDDEWIPDFSRPNPFPVDYSDVAWHWKETNTAAGGSEEES